MGSPARRAVRMETDRKNGRMRHLWRNRASVLRFLTGAIVLASLINVAVAWMSQARVDWPQLPFGQAVTEPRPWPVPVPQYWPPPDYHAEVRFFGVSRADYVSAGEGYYYLVAVLRSGWPFKALSSESWINPGPHAWRAGLPVSSDLRIARGWGRLPLMPIWPGFLLNTLVYAAPAAGILLGAHRLRVHFRKRRGCCCACGYSLRGLPDAVPCPECGTVQ
jgi:hypothetical protein